jgi:hypothetical protein
LKIRWGLYTPKLSNVLSPNTCGFGKISDSALLDLAMCLA